MNNTFRYSFKETDFEFYLKLLISSRFKLYNLNYMFLIWQSLFTLPLQHLYCHYSYFHHVIETNQNNKLLRTALIEREFF